MAMLSMQIRFFGDNVRSQLQQQPEKKQRERKKSSRKCQCTASRRHEDKNNINKTTKWWHDDDNALQYGPTDTHTQFVASIVWQCPEHIRCTRWGICSCFQFWLAEHVAHDQASINDICSVFGRQVFNVIAWCGSVCEKVNICARMVSEKKNCHNTTTTPINSLYLRN